MIRVLSALVAIIGAVLLGVAPASAQTYFFQDFDSGVLGANEAVSGDFTLGDGYVGHHNAFYGNAETGSYSFTANASGNLFLNYDYAIDTEGCCDPLTVIVNGQAVQQYRGTGLSGRANISLGNLGSGPVSVVFSFYSDPSVVYRGVRLDNIDLSNTATTAPPVPEPATWAMMILGMGAVGYAIRRRKVTTRVSCAT